MKILAITAAAVLLLVYGGAKFYLHHKTERGMEQAVQQLAPIMEVKYGGVSSSMTGELTIDNLSIRINGFRDAIRIKSLGLDTPSMLSFFEIGKLARQEGGELPEYFGVFAEEVVIDSQADYYKKLYWEYKKAIDRPDFDAPGAKCIGKYGIYSPKTLTAMGYDAQVVSYAITLRQGESEFYIDMDIGMRDMFDMKISLALGGDMMTELSRGKRYRPQLSNLRIEHTDRSLLQRIKKHCAELGLTPEQTLAAHLDALDYFGKKNRIAFDKQLVDPYREFLAGKPKLVITARPRRLIDFAEIPMYNPKDVPALLNLETAAF